MERYGRTQEGSQSNPVSEWRGPGPETGLEEGFWTMRLGEGEFGYPERPDEPDCPYYLRTGFCGYGSRCRFNHPRDRTAVLGAVRAGGGEFPERVGQPLCQYYMRTGTCKFGASCKYHHPQQGSDSVAPVHLNSYGYPLRPGEKECTYYVKTGQCKFGRTCKFHHPQLPSMQIPAQSVAAHIAPVPAPVPTPALYQTMQSPSGPSSQPYGVVVARPPLLPSSYSPYGPVLLPPGAVPYPSWNPYAASISPLASPGTQSAIGSGSMYGITQQSASAPVYTGSYQPIPTSLGPSSTEQKELPFPDRPGQPECQYYMKTGECKYGSSCRYHHPPDLVAPRANVAISPIGLPLRPGLPVCHHYTQRGQCKFGLTCKFDHPMSPMRELSYSPSASSLADMPVAPYPVGSSVGTLAPSSSSSELRLEQISGVSKDSSSTRMSSSLSSSSSGSVGPILSKSGAVQSGVQQSSQASSSPAGGGGGSGSTDVRTSS